MKPPLGSNHQMAGHATASKGRPPLSQAFTTILAKSEARDVTLNDLMRGTEGRGLYLVMILLSLPFVTPIPVPGLSSVLGLVIALLAIRLAFELPPRLPAFIGARGISRRGMRKIVHSSTGLLRMLEKLSKPRRSDWMEWRMVRFFNAIALVLMALLLALPLPPVVPFSNLLPSWTIIVLALAMMERDGILIWIGYTMTLGTLIYMLFFTGLVVSLVQRFIGSLGA